VGRIASTVIKVLVCLLLCSAALAQTVPTAEISGTATDSTGAVAPGADLQLTQSETGFKTPATKENGLLCAA
jgi:hypothetical protein